MQACRMALVLSGTRHRRRAAHRRASTRYGRPRGVGALMGFRSSLPSALLNGSMP